MIERAVYTHIQKIEDPTLRNIADKLAHLILDNWFYALVLLLLWRFPYIVADLSDTEVTPRRPTGDSVFWQSVMAQALLIACLSMSYNLLFGFSGVISFGHALFFGAGGYITFLMMREYDGAYQIRALIVLCFITLCLALFVRVPIRRLLIFLIGGIVLILLLMPNNDKLSFYQAVGLSVIGSIILSLISGTVTLRLRGVYFAMFTLALAEMFYVLAKSGTFREITGAEDGLVIRDLIPESLNPTQTFEGHRLMMYRITVIFFVIVFLAIRRYLNSPIGRIMLAIRENEVRARTIGYNTFYYKLITMIFAGVIASLSGVLFVLWGTAKRVDPSLLSLTYTVDPLLYTLIGGVGTITGPIIAALGLVLGETYLRDEVISIGSKTYPIAEVWDLFLGILFVLVVMLLPNGIVGTWNKWRAEQRIRKMERDLQRSKDRVA